jgi:hypothetical protein
MRGARVHAGTGLLLVRARIRSEQRGSTHSKSMLACSNVRIALFGDDAQQGVELGVVVYELICPRRD